MYARYFKRPLDFLVSLTGFILLFPLFVAVTLALFWANRGKPFFLQPRPGKNERIFKLIKFKTMNDRKDKEGNLLPDTERLTPAGRLVRKTSLDEIPQLLNVIRGDMSLIGPRPLLPEYLPFYSERHRKRHLVRPGITGLAQVKGRNLLKFSKRFDLDVEYVENLSLKTDLKIIFLTMKKICSGSDIALGQTREEVDDIGITKGLPDHYFKA